MLARRCNIRANGRKLACERFRVCRLFVERLFQFLLLSVRNLFSLQRFGLSRFFTFNENRDVLSSSGEIAGKSICSLRYCHFFVECLFQFLLLGISNFFSFKRLGLSRFLTFNEKRDLLSSSGKIAAKNICSFSLSVQFQPSRSCSYEGKRSKNGVPTDKDHH